jgi:KaiC/GvpD/RAD55 family RecA-like ATPase
METEFSPLVRETLLDLAKEKHFDSGFHFLNAHNGLRREKVHTFIAPAGSGKSTFFRTILGDILNRNPEAKIAIYLSEDEKASFLIDLAKSSIKDSDINNRIKIFYELDQKELANDQEVFFKNLNDLCKDFRPDVFILDNLTTLPAYLDKKTEVQGNICMRLKKFTQFFNCSTIVFAHTGSNLQKGSLTDPNDIRGSKHMANLSHFFYTIQQISFFNPEANADQKVTMLMIHKHRGVDLTGHIFAFRYDSKTGMYSYDERINFEQFKRLFDKRHKL